MIRVLDFSLDEPEMNLALDEVILDAVERGRAGSTLRFWESPRPFVVLGTGQALHEEVHEEACVADGLPIMRRCSAGGCVLQGPGSLNYALALTFEDFPRVRSLRDSYVFILGALAGAFARHGVPLRHEGISDLALAGKKVSGNAQRRRRAAILHHGTLLYRADPGAMKRYLAEPRERPGYRGPRAHDAFVTAIPLEPEEIRDCIREAMNAPGPSVDPTPEELAQAHALAEEKYRTEAWIRRR